jgi:hypothetical protein
MKRIIKILLIASFIFSGATIANAQTAQESATIQIPTSKNREVTSLSIYAVNAENERLLGDVTVMIDDIQLKISDPPPIDGLLVPSFAPGSHHVVGKRKGYEAVDQNISVDPGKEHQKLTLEFNPISGTPDISESDVNNYLSNYQSINSFGSVTNAMYPNQAGNAYSSGTTLVQWSDGTTSTIPANNINLTNTSQTHSVPVKISLINNGFQINGTELTQIQIIDKSSNIVELSNTMVENSTFSGSQTLYRYGCLQPNRQYALIIKSLTNQTAQPITFTFVSGQIGEYTEIKINVAAFYNTNISPYSSGLISSSNNNASLVNLPSCPSSQISQNLTQFGTQVWSGGQINLNNFNIVLSHINGNYYLVNKTNQLDSRQITFIDRGDGKGGFAFIPTQPSVQGVNLSQNNAKDWYVTTYTRDGNGEINFLIDPSPSNISPSQYERALNKQIVENFTEIKQKSDENTTDSDNNISSNIDTDLKLDDNCKAISGQKICLFGDSTIEKYEQKDLDQRISMIVQKVNNNISISKDKKGSPFLNVLTDNTTFDNIFGETALAVTCPLHMNSQEIGNIDHRCVQVLRGAIGEESFKDLTTKLNIKDMTFMAYRDEDRSSSIVDSEILKNTIDHEWAHVYDFQSDFKENNESISENNKYIFSSFFTETSAKAKEQAELFGSEQTFNFEGNSKNYPLCDYFALEFAPFVSIDSKNTRVSFQFSGNVFAGSTEIFAYSFGLYKYDMLDKVTNLMSDANVDSPCKEKISALINENSKFFND